MVRITEELIRKKSEHNELMISTLEEISLHQEDIEKIEHIQNWCRDLKILLLQSNLISKIENLHKLKKLEYLNLALNNIIKIENLDKLESLNKLDLTLNFIGELTSVDSLKDNYNLKDLILTGNPCADYVNYRDYVITVLPQLESLDSIPIKISDRIKAKKVFLTAREKIIQAEAQYRISRDEQKIRVHQKQNDLHAKMMELNDEESNKLFWETASEHCPETRVEISKQQHKIKKRTEVEKKEKPKLRLFAPCGRPYNLNHPKLEFLFHDEMDRYELTLKVYKFLDTSFLDVDVQPNYIRVVVKGKIFQLALQSEIRTSESFTKRSTITGDLLIVMPKEKTEGSKFPMEIKSRGALREPTLKNGSSLKGTVNYKNIIKPTEKQLATSFQQQDEAELPDLV